MRSAGICAGSWATPDRRTLLTGGFSLGAMAMLTGCDVTETSGCRYNAFYPEDQAPQLAPATYKLDLSGAIRDERPWRVDQLYQLPQSSQLTRHVRG